MPGRNIVKLYLPDSFYHVYNRGVEHRDIFIDKENYAVFLNLLKRYLNPKATHDNYGRPYDNFHKDIELLAYCLMPNHFHLLFYQHNQHAMTRLLRAVMSSYVTYFNKCHDRVGPLFQDVFKASDIDQEGYLLHISRYIHLNPLDIGQDYGDYPYSSYDFYVGNRKAFWIKPARILELHENTQGSYADFVEDFVDYKKTLAEVKYFLA